MSFLIFFSRLIFLLIFILDLKSSFIFHQDFQIKNYTLISSAVHKKVFLNNKNANIFQEYFNVVIYGKVFSIILDTNLNKTLLYNDTATLVIYQNSSKEKKMLNSFVKLVNGHIDEYSYDSMVEGFIADNKFYGIVQFKGDKFYIEEKKSEMFNATLNKNYNAIFYSMNNNLNTKCKNNEKKYFTEAETIGLKSETQHFSLRPSTWNKMFSNFVKKRHICSLFVLLDYSFIKMIHKGNIKKAVSQILISINEANSIFRSTDFDGDGIPDNLGFFIKHFVVVETENSPFNYLPTFTKKPMNAKHFLAHFAQYIILREVCLGVLFTAQVFGDNVLGVSYSANSEFNVMNEIMGGICQRPFSNYLLALNALAVTYSVERGFRPSQATLDICLTHELGHSFGSRHDNKRDNGYRNNYLMSSKTLSGEEPNNFQFSPLSKEHILITVPKKGHCLVKMENPFCGNGVVELNEECDCGPSSLCKINDPCCVPPGSIKSCQINREKGYECHPDQNFCCKKNCLLKEIVDFDCHQSLYKCPCVENKACHCGFNGFCINKECHNQECVRINAKECRCPSSGNGCHICCISNTSCLPSYELTEIKVAQKSIAIETLKKFENNNDIKKQIWYQTFCDNYGNCVKLPFFKSKPTEYCLENGAIGICLLNSGCITDPKKLTRSNGNLRCHHLLPFIFSIVFKFIYCILFAIT